MLIKSKFVYWPSVQNYEISRETQEIHLVKYKIRHSNLIVPSYKKIKFTHKKKTIKYRQKNIDLLRV